MCHRVEFENIEARPIAGARGAEISGVDTSRPMEASVVDEIREALDRFLVIFFRDQELSLDQLKSFSVSYRRRSACRVE